MKLYDVEESAQKDISESGQPATQFLTERNKKSQIETKGFTF
jgi:hypothetical protein